MKNKLFTIVLSVTILSGCKNEDNLFDASGTFESVETIISAEANGKVLSIALNEGEELKAGTLVGYIDSTQLYLNREVLLQNQKAVLSGRPDIETQLDALKEELSNATNDRDRIANLVKGGVASQKQLDDANARIATIDAKIRALKSTLQTSTNVVNKQGGAVDAQLNLVNDQISKCRIINPVNGTVLVKYVEANEMVFAGKPLYKISDLSTIILRIYITGDQLPSVKLGQEVKVNTDDGKGGFKETKGSITWISDKAEFTPKSIMTKNERANLVYAVKVKVKNDGYLKIGMYAEVKF